MVTTIPISRPWLIAGLCIALCWDLRAGEVPSQATAPALVTVEIDPPGPVRYVGLIGRDEAGYNSQSSNYDASAGLVGVLLQIALHGAISAKRRDDQTLRLQQISDSISAPHNAALAEFTTGDLIKLVSTTRMSAGSYRIGTPASALLPSTRRLKCTPVFGIAEDESTLVLASAIQITRPDAQGAPAYNAVVKVVWNFGAAAARPAGEAASAVAAATAGRLKAATQQMFAHAIDLAIRDSLGEFNGANEAERTHRYRQGPELQIERGRRLAGSCQRVIVRNLTGGLASLPSTDPADAACPAP